MDIPDISASINHTEGLFCIDQTLVKMEPRNDYDEASIIVIKQEINSDDENETNDGQYYGYIDTSTLEEGNDGLISGTENYSEESGGELSLQNSDTTKYVMICEDVEDNSGVLHLRLLNKKPLIRTFKLMPNSVEDNKQKLKTNAHIKKNTMMPTKVEPDVERPFKCSECDEMFEVRSHLVMHEIGHESYKKYKTSRSTVRPVLDVIKQEAILHVCNECGASFENKSHLHKHQMYHEDDKNSKCLCRKSLRTTSDLCKCFVRECQSCHRKFFAAIKLGNWSACIKCFFLKDSNLKHMETSEELDNQNSSMYSSVKTIDIKQKSIETVTNVKKLCYSCGKMCSNVINAGISWLCYDCWNTKMKDKGIKRIKRSYPQIRKRLKYRQTDCMYCLQLFPFKSLRKDHQCLHKSVYLKDENEFSQTQIENDSYIKVKLGDDKIGQHFLLSSMDNSLESPILSEYSEHSKYTSRTLTIPSKPFKSLSDFSLNALPSKQLKQSQSWITYSDDGGDSDCEEGQIIEETIDVEVLHDDDNSTRTVILCDKTGELIDLNSELAQSQQNENNISVQL